MPRVVVLGRMRSCANCPTPCQDRPNAALEASSCPLQPARWPSWDVHLQRQAARRGGLGDAVAAVAHPAATVLDMVLGTNLKGCGGCGKRQAKLNKAGRAVRKALHL